MFNGHNQQKCKTNDCLTFMKEKLLLEELRNIWGKEGTGV